VRYKGKDGEEEGRRVSRTCSCVGTMGLLLSLGAICSQGSDIGVTPVYKNKKRRAYWLKETRLRTWRGKERTWLLWKGPCRGHREEYLYDVPWPGCIPAAYIPTSSSPRAECVQCIVLPPARFLPLRSMKLHHVTATG
jgi:hypothetical protein